MSKATVALTRCQDYSQPKIAEAIANQFNLLGGMEKFVKAGDTVLIKPNFITPMPASCAVQTDPAVILETARLLKDFGAKPIVGDSPAWGNITECVKALKLDEPLRKLNVPVIQLDKPKRVQLGKEKNKIGISSVALEADVIINLPKFKSHQQLVATFAIKNMFGTVSGKRKALCHFVKGGEQNKFCEMLIDIYKLLNPALTIVDGIIAMDGSGPIYGRARELGFLIGSTDPIACEVVCSKLVNFEPEKLPIIKTAKQMGFSCPNLCEIEIVGDNFPEKTCTDFEPAEPMPLKFSFLHICKSVALQILLLAKSAIKTKPKN